MKIQTLLDQIDLGAMALPEFQRGYVWNRDQVRRLMASLYRRHPVGGLLVWTTRTENADARGDGPLTPGSVKLLLDGQQRLTSLYGILRGKAPLFFRGNAQAFTGLRFHLDTEAFEFYGPVKMGDDPRWVDVTRLMKEGIGGMLTAIMQDPDLQPGLQTYVDRLNRLGGIKDIDLHIEEVTGEEKTVDVVVEIFNTVNSGGTRLSKGDLALAKVCAEWPDARKEMEACLGRWRAKGYDFELDWLLRNINTILTGEAFFSALKDVTPADFQAGLTKAEKHVNTLLNLISGRLGLDHDRVLGSRYAFPLMSRYLEQRGGKLADHKERDRLLYWYLHTALWGRYSTSVESVLNQDLRLIEETEGGLDRLIGQLRQNRGDLTVRAGDFNVWSTGSRFYPLLYLLTRVSNAKDWGDGLPLSANLLGRDSRLHVHHIFPRSLLYAQNYSKSEVNAVGNFCFLTQQTNLEISNQKPEDYFPKYEAKNPGALASQWIPVDPELWKIENFLDFLAARRELLAKSANEFLDGLFTGTMPVREMEPASEQFRSAPSAPTGGVESEAEEEILLECLAWVAERGLPEGVLEYQLADPDTREPQAILDLAWPNGLQEGLSQPVALLIDEGRETEDAAAVAGFRCFQDLDSFKGYVETEVLALKGLAA